MARVLSDKPVGAFERVCPGCHYRIEFCGADIREGSDPDDGDRWKYVTCPRRECRRKIDLLVEERERAKYEDMDL